MKQILLIANISQQIRILTHVTGLMKAVNKQTHTTHAD